MKLGLEQSDINENQVHLCGTLMGGNSTNGVGMRHSEVIVAIAVNVPARVTSRMCFAVRTLTAKVTLSKIPQAEFVNDKEWI